MKIFVQSLIVIIFIAAIVASYSYLQEQKTSKLLRAQVATLHTENKELVKNEKKVNTVPYELITANNVEGMKTATLSCRAGVGGSECTLSERGVISSSTKTHAFRTSYPFLPLTASEFYTLLAVNDSYVLLSVHNSASSSQSYFGVLTYKDGNMAKYDTVFGKVSSSSPQMIFAKKKDDTTFEIIKVGEDGNVATSTLMTLPKASTDAGFVLGRDCSLIKTPACSDKEIFRTKIISDIFTPVTGQVAVITHNAKTKVGSKDIVIDYRDFILKN